MRKLNYLRSNFPTDAYSSTKLYCPKCDLSLKKQETIYDYRGYPSKCQKCNARIKFGCTQCEKLYMERSGLLSHVKMVHGEPKIYECPQPNCNFVTRWKKSLTLHTQSNHHNEGREKCKNCGKYVKDLKRHERMACTNKKISCASRL